MLLSFQNIYKCQKNWETGDNSIPACVSLSLQYAVDNSRHTFSRSSMDINITTDGGGGEPVTPDELDEVLKGLTTFGDMDYG